MTPQSIALPRAKVRKKRRKPPGPWFWYLLVWVVIDLLLVGIGLVNGSVAWLVTAAVYSAFFGVLDWPRFKREWKAWRDSE